MVIPSAFFPTYCIFYWFSQVEREVHEDLCWSHEGAASSALRSKSCTEVRRYAVVALTNLTFGNGRIWVQNGRIRVQNGLDRPETKYPGPRARLPPRFGSAKLRAELAKMQCKVNVTPSYDIDP